MAFKGLVLEQNDGTTTASVREISIGELPAGDVLVKVAYSSLNYKDGLAVTGRGKVIRQFPMVPGIDLAGVVEQSSSSAFQPGDAVVATGWGLGEQHWGGYAQYARVNAGWLVPLPAGFSLEQSMAIGTAGFTAMLCLMALEEHGLTPAASKPVVVSGAAGGVGSVAVALLASRGYKVTAITGRKEAHDYLRSLGAAEILDRAEVGTGSTKPLEKERWSGAVDTVGGEMLASILRTLSYGASAAACGLAGGGNLPTSVFPFILRNVSLLGIDSVMCPAERRRAAWARLASELQADKLAFMTQVVPLGDIPAWSVRILDGQVRGRVVVDVSP
ncbi:MAG: oxidoreductase [Acidobacteriota bacterium]|nr:oxidoreductase [Acidobacteriota bacterium]